MATLVKPWNDGGNLSVTYEGSGDGTAVFASDAYEGIDREQSVVFKGAELSIERTVRQEGKRQQFRTKDWLVFRCNDGGRFGVLKSTPYIELEYIESTGTQWIRTGIFPDDSTIKCEVKIAYSSTSTGQLMGSGISGNERFNFGIESRKFRFGFGGSCFDANSEVSTPDTEPHIFILDANTKTGYVDGVPQTTTNSYTATGSNVFMLFARGTSNSAEGGNRTKGKLYYVKLWNKDKLVRDLIPVIDDEGIACMYDKVSGGYFYNQGTGDFIVGYKE